MRRAPEPIATILPRTLRTIARARSVRAMTTNDDTERDYELARRAALLIEDEADNGAENPVEAAKAYVTSVLDDGQDRIPGVDDVPVWELVEMLGFTPQDDPFVIAQAIHELIDNTDLFNG